MADDKKDNKAEEAAQAPIPDKVSTNCTERRASKSNDILKISLLQPSSPGASWRQPYVHSR